MMRTPARDRFAALLRVLAFVLTASASAQPLRIDAAESARNFAYGVYVDGRRFPVTATPVRVAQGQAVHIQGWALDSRTMRPAASLLVAIDGGDSTTVASYPVARPDIARMMRNTDDTNCGFELPISLDTFKPGLHRFHFTLVGTDSAQVPLPTDVQLFVESR